MFSRALLGLCGVILLTLAGCDTPASRARVHHGAFGKLSAGDRRLVLAGKVRAGMNPDAVYIAWGEPDTKEAVPGCKDDITEVWSYRRQLTLKSAMNSFDAWLPGNSVFGRTVPLTVNGGLGFGGVGNEGVTLYQPHLLISDDTIKRAEFERGELTKYETFQAGSAAAAR